MTPDRGPAPTESLPVLQRADVLVVHGSLAGCVAALAIARRGLRVVLASPAASLPMDWCVTRRAWIAPARLGAMPLPWRAAFQSCCSGKTARGERLLNLAALATRTEDLLLDAGVRLLYGMFPCGVAMTGKDTVSAVVFGGKFGLAAIEAGSIVDCTPAAAVANLAGHAPSRRSIPRAGAVVRVFAKCGVPDDAHPLICERGQRNTCPVQPASGSSLPAPGAAALPAGQVLLHGPYAEFPFRLPVDPLDPLWPSALAGATRQALVQAGAAVRGQRQAAGLPPVFFHRFSGELETEPLVRIRAARRARPFQPAGLDNLYVCGPAADVDAAAARALAAPGGAARLALRIALRLEPAPARRRRRASAVFTTAPSQAAGITEAPLLTNDAPPLHTSGARLRLGRVRLPVLASCDVLVAGGGTSGVPAALAAAQAGASTILIEQHHDLGGVRTIGGVGSYWFGVRTPCQSNLDAALDDCASQTGMAEEIAMRRILEDAGVRVLAACPVVAVLRRAATLQGIVVATGSGLAVVRAKTFVDATSDADLAAWAGEPFEYGNGRDAWTLWASFGDFNAEKRTASRHYESAIEVRDPADFTRTAVQGRRRPGMWAAFPHEMPQHYVTPRESRRLLGRATVTYGGILAGQTFADTMIVCRSNFDIKGLATSGLACCGVVSSWRVHKTFAAAIPYRAILTPNLDNLLVAGRAYSASHDALSLARMQRDMLNLGAAAGLAAAMSAASGVALPDLRLPALRAAWLSAGVILPQDQRRFARPEPRYTAACARGDAAALLAGSRDRSLHLARLMRSSSSVKPLLAAFRRAKSPASKEQIARALCYLGDTSTVPFLLQTIERQIGRGLPRPFRKTLAVPPEHGWAGAPAYSLWAIAMSGAGRRAAPLMAAIARMIPHTPDLFGSKRDSPFEYVRAICAVAERCPGPAMIPPLEFLRSKDCLRSPFSTKDGDPRKAADRVGERLAYLGLCIGRALARCADLRGYDILCACACDARGPIARGARAELAALLDAPVPAASAAIKRLCAQSAAARRPRPFVDVLP